MLLLILKLSSPHRENQGGGGYLGGVVFKENIGELEEGGSLGCLKRMRNDLTGVVQGISGKKRFLVNFQDGCKNNLSSDQLTIVIV